jgi:hypothetical protein
MAAASSTTYSCAKPVSRRHPAAPTRRQRCRSRGNSRSRTDTSSSVGETGFKSHCLGCFEHALRRSRRDPLIARLRPASALPRDRLPRSLSPGIGRYAENAAPVSGLTKLFPGRIPSREQRPVRMSAETGSSLANSRRTSNKRSCDWGWAGGVQLSQCLKGRIFPTRIADPGEIGFELSVTNHLVRQAWPNCWRGCRPDAVARASGAISDVGRALRCH